MEELINDVFDRLDAISSSMTKGAIIDEVGSIQDLISDEMGWDGSTDDEVEE